MNLLRIVLLALIGAFAGVEIGTGLSAVFASLRFVSRLAFRTNSSEQIRNYENCILIGGGISNFAFLYLDKIMLSEAYAYLFLFVLGIFFGIYVGCLAMAIAEILDAFTIMMRQLKMKDGEIFIVLSVAVGKMVGNLIYFFR